MLKKLKEEVLEANITLFKSGLVLHTWGNVSGIDRENLLVVIKPSGLGYEKMKINDMVVLNLEGNVIEGELQPSSDAPTHIELYKNFPCTGGIAHTHSTYATAWAQAGRAIPAMGTSHADHFYGDIPCTRKMSPHETAGNYEENTGRLIVDTFKNADAASVPGVLVNDHGPFTWGRNPGEAVYNATVLEEVARIAILTHAIAGYDIIDKHLMDKHFNRKHGRDAYYGQKKKNHG
ncbi:MAG: L-ribulose-5-phosphate 4-epimerase [Bacteroidales bacterium]|nr:L-ribulose-5-phosphate 4-epimerase [Bacteroidales bacterium]